jgi:dTDP-4-amino-4,6-dideoxygalactose transaminase
MITTNNPELAKWILSYKHFGMGMDESRLATSFDRIGSNHKLSNVLSAIGLGQMKHINQLLDQRRIISRQYISILKEQKAIVIPATTTNGRHSYQSFCIYIDHRNHVMKELRAMGIEVQIGTYALHMHPAFKASFFCHVKNDMHGSRYAFDHCLTLPLYHDMTEDVQAYIIKNLLKTL